MTIVNKRLLFVGVSSMPDHAGQDKLYFLAHELGLSGIPVTVLVPDLEANRNFFADKPHVETRFYRPGSAAMDAIRKSRVVDEALWTAIWVVGVGLRSFIVRGRRSCRIPLIKDFDEFPSMIESIGSFRRQYLRFIERRMIGQAEAFTCASAYLEYAVRQQRPALGNRLLRLRVAISSAEFEIDVNLVRRLRESANGRPVFLYVGSVNRMYEQQIVELIKLAIVLRTRGSPAKVIIAGTGPDVEYFKRKVASARVGDSLEFAGYVRRNGDLAAHMAAAQVLIFPFPGTAFNISRCPTKAFHYAAANRPVVTNMTGEVATLFGDAALYYPEGDAQALADRCQEALARTEGFSNGIPFSTLTWKARAQEFEQWLDVQGWLPPRSQAVVGQEGRLEPRPSRRMA